VIGDILQPTHLLLVLVVALLVLGPKRLPEMARTLGSGLRDFRSAINGDEREDQPDKISDGTPPASAEQPDAPQVVAPEAPATPDRASVPAEAVTVPPEPVTAPAHPIIAPAQAVTEPAEPATEASGDLEPVADPEPVAHTEPVADLEPVADPQPAATHPAPSATPEAQLTPDAPDPGRA
jgi:TatA/E family protein of Tat protein translocase